MTDLLVQQREITPDEDHARRSRFPRGAAVSLDDLERAGREFVIDDLRTHEPVSWVPALNGWLVTSRQAARELLASPTATVQSHQNLVRASLGRMMLTVDGDEHSRQRKPFERPFKIGTLEEAFSPAITRVVDDLLDRLAPAGRAELGDAFAAPFAVRMAGHVLGLSLTETRRITDFYSAFAGAMVYDGDPAPQHRADRARAELDEILHAELARARREPDHSITALMARDSRGLTDEEIVAQLRVVMFGAIETVQASIMNTLLLLLQHPDQLAAVTADPSLLAQAGEEARRLIPPVAFVERWTTSPTTVAGVEIPADEFVGVSVLGANRDPATFADPLAFDIRRQNSNRALSFSFGIHACLGLHLARLETTIALRRIIERLPDLQLVSHDEPAGFAFRRPETMQLQWSGA